MADEMNTDERAKFEAWARNRGYQYDELDRCRIGIVGPEYYNLNTEMAWQAWQASAQGFRDGVASLSAAEPVAEVVDCSVMGQQTLREIDGRWKFLRTGDKLYTHPAPAQPSAVESNTAYAALTDEEILNRPASECGMSAPGTREYDLELVRWYERKIASHGQAPAGAALPAGWVPLTITHAGQHPEQVAYGPKIMMDRLGKWLGKYFAQATQADSVQEDAARWRFAESHMTYAEFRDGSYFNCYMWGQEEAQHAARAVIDAARAAQKEGE